MTRVRIASIKGPKGDQGIPGPGNDLTVASVETGAPGSLAKVDVEGESPSQRLRFTLPRGDKGEKGDPNVLTVESVETGLPGTQATVTVAGEAPSQRLSFTLPRGDKGEHGDPAQLSIDSVTTTEPGSPAEVEVLGEAPIQSLRFSLPRGETGPANVLSVGAVTTGAAGSQASANISGDAPEQTLDLTIPKGDPGIDGANGSAIISLTNQKTNGDLASGNTTGWLFDGATGAVVGGALQVTPTATPTSATTTQHAYQTVNLVNGYKYYARARMKGATTLRLQVTTATVGSVTVADTWQTLSGIYTSTVTALRAFGVRDTAASGWTMHEVDNAIFIDLTSTFGPGREPTLAEMDSLIDTYYAGYINGTIQMPIQDYLDMRYVLRTSAAYSGDFNTLLTPGLYWVSTANSTAPKNSPTPGSGGFLTVMNSGGGSIVQEWTNHGNLRTRRYSTNGGTNWSSWSIGTLPDGRLKGITYLDDANGTLRGYISGGTDAWIRFVQYIGGSGATSWTPFSAQESLRELYLATNGTAVNIAAPITKLNGVHHLSGTGSPEGVVTAPVGSRYVDNAATIGAVEWIKASGSGNTGWKVSYGDTGWRDITSTVDGALWNNVSSSSNYLKVRREGNTAHVNCMISRTLAGGTRAGAVDGQLVSAMPSGFVPLTITATGIVGMNANPWTTLAANVQIQLTHIRVMTGTGSWLVGDGVRFMVSGPCDQSWPTILPGTAG